MKLEKLLLETAVNSSWITDISYHSRHNRVFPGEPYITFTTKNNNKTYIIRGVSRKTFNTWLKFPSKGKFWHAIKNKIDRSWFTSKPFQITKWSKVPAKPNM